MGKNVVTKIRDLVKIKTVLLSVSDKTSLETFVPGLIEVNPNILIISTGGTYNRVKEILGDKTAFNLWKVSQYTGQPETQGGLVKTLDFKIYLGLLTETFNEKHQKDLQRTEALTIDMVVVKHQLKPGAFLFAKKTKSLRFRRNRRDLDSLGVIYLIYIKISI